ncbi:energy-coupling factor transporter transmembrane component T [Conexibacter woesei]|uniref:energy-coupling factor transporter transmembrane component T n=1 Tax=Conexibacter woesei TaxID=191495 RepID=UPI0009DB7EDE|nr:energy-coupling factor transporter transmembrane component T [Conexibacter woesei]
MRYVRRASPLHAARAVAGGAWCAALAVAALAAQSPLVLVGLALLVVLGAVGAGVGREVGRIVAWMVPWAVVIAVINMLVVRQGFTILARLGEVPPFGQVDLTLEALVYGLLFGLRLLVVAAAFCLFSAAVDPDDLLRVLRRASVRSALAATLATRLVPVLAADAARVSEARRCRADGGGEGAVARVAVLRAVASNALDRALDVAATLEVRGYGSARRGGSGGPPWSRHDRAFLTSAVVLVALTVAARVWGWAEYGTYPELHAPGGAGEAWALLVAYAVVALLPFADRRGIGG